MPITVDSLIRDAHEIGEDLATKYSLLWDTMLDDDNGISEDVYNRLVELGNIIDPSFVKAVSRHVDATDGRFYIKRSYR